MKNLIFSIAITGILGACLYGCQKEGSKAGSSSVARPELIFSKSTVAREEPLVVTARGLSSGTALFGDPLTVTDEYYT